MYRHFTVYIPIQRSLILIQRSQKCNLCTELMNDQGEKIERFKRFRLKFCWSISLSVKNMASGAPRGHITTGIFSTDKVSTDMIISITDALLERTQLSRAHLARKYLSTLSSRAALPRFAWRAPRRAAASRRQ